jgi:hypothetical protein
VLTRATTQTKRASTVIEAILRSMQFMKEEVHMILKMTSVAKNNIIGEEQIKD